jgi:hypothetical protein
VAEQACGQRGARATGVIEPVRLAGVLELVAVQEADDGGEIESGGLRQPVDLLLTTVRREHGGRGGRASALLPYSAGAGAAGCSSAVFLRPT